MMGHGNVKMKGKLVKIYDCGCCIAYNLRKLGKYSSANKSQEIRTGINEFYSDEEVVYTDPYMRSLYPNSKKISSYYHYLFGYDVLLVDGVLEGELEDAIELLSYAYHTGASYKDRLDLERQYSENLNNCKGRGWFLP